jgi:hypothetical protein
VLTLSTSGEGANSLPLRLHLSTHQSLLRCTLSPAINFNGSNGTAYTGPSKVQNKDKDLADGLEIAQSFILCRQHAYKAHINSIDIFIHNDGQAEVVKGRFMDKGSDIDITRLNQACLSFRSSPP